MIFNNFKIAYNMYFRLLMLQDLIYQATFLPQKLGFVISVQ